MNYMKKQTKKHLADLSGAVGDFIRYWGFRRIHGEIWTQVYLSQDPLSGVDLTERLGVSKALVSPALKELLDYDLILVKPENGKTKRYYANPNVFEVIKQILQKREMVLIEAAIKHYAKVNECDDSAIDKDRLNRLGQMVNLAQLAAGFVVLQTDDENFSNWVGGSEQ